jgi:hypothetical protein
MPDLTNKIQNLREILKDVPNANYQGLFWQPHELRLALNLSQDIFCQFVIKSKLFYLFSHLVTQTPVIPDNTVYWQVNQWQPPPLLYPISAYICNPQTGAPIEIARIYFGDGLSYLEVGHSACIIINNVIRFITSGPIRTGIPANGQLIYYRKPSPILIASPDIAYMPNIIPGFQYTDIDFDDQVYDSYIIPYAVVILGMKEISTQRDFKYRLDYIKSIMGMPEDFANFIMDYEFTGDKTPTGRPPSAEVQ